MNSQQEEWAPRGKRQGERGSQRMLLRPTNGLLRNLEVKIFIAPFGANAHFWLLASWLCVIFALGGTSRPDTESLLALRPLSVLVTGAGLWTLSGTQVVRLRGSFAFVTVIMMLIAVQLIPLPPAWWSALPGRRLIVEIDKTVGILGTWRPISMSPPWTWNAFWFMFTPLSVLVHAAQLEVVQIRKLGGVILFVGLVSGILAIAQVAGDPKGPLFLYRISHFGVAVGLFANRNHQAVFLAALVPIALVLLRRYPIKVKLDQRYNKRLDLTNVVVLALACALFPLVLASGSRAGFAALIASVLVSMVVLSPFARKTDGHHTQKRKAKPTQQFLWAAAAILGGVAVTGIALMNDRALSIDRFIDVDPLEDMRTKILPTVFMMIRTYAPVGSGIGTFEPVYQIHEPDELLIPTYANHIHNDWLEVVMTAGVPGVLLLIWMVTAWLAGVGLCVSGKAKRARPEHELAIAGLVVILLTGLASISDYPLRTPSFAALFVIMLVWINLGLSKVDSYRGGRSASSREIGQEGSWTV